MRLLKFFALAGAMTLLAASPAAAVPVVPLDIEVLVETPTSSGGKAWPSSGVETADGLYYYQGSRTDASWKLDWSVLANPDPSVSANTVITNITGTTNTYTILVSLPLGSAITPSSITGGSVQGGFTDNNGNGATVTTAGAAPFYYSQIDGVNFVPLYSAPVSLSVGPSKSGTFPAVSFGDPIPSFPGPAALTDIGIQLKFTLTPGDSATFSSVFVVEPVPEPTSLALLVTGAAGCSFVVIRRRRAST